MNHQPHWKTFLSSTVLYFMVSEAQRHSPDQEFTYRDIKKALGNSKGTALGPTLDRLPLCINIYFYVIPNTFVKALNELAFVSGLSTYVASGQKSGLHSKTREDAK